jgi:hypothetical protein
MALTAVLEFGDNNIKRYSKRYLVADCRFVFALDYNDFRPSDAPRCEKVEVTVVAPGKESPTLYEWHDSRGVNSGRIVLSRGTNSRPEESDDHILYFENAQCFSLREEYDIDNNRRRMLVLGIDAESFNIDGEIFKHL